MSGFDGYIGAFRHGGFCCGVTHIYGFHQGPSAKLTALTPKKPEEIQPYIQSHPSYWGYYQLEFPQQTARERLEATIHAIARGSRNCMGRRGGIIEVALTNGQKQYWDHVLLEIGFVETFKAVNSNTNNTITMYHFDTNGYNGKFASKTEKAKAAPTPPRVTPPPIDL